MIYLHIPFCQKRCIYCDFYSTTYSSDIRRQFVRSLCLELESRRDYIPSNPVPSVYFGGGTPSQLSFDEIAEIMSCIRANYVLSDQAEITFEANPDDITSVFADELCRMGFNRVSLGVQSFDDGILKMLNRRHTADQAVKAVYTLADRGLSNVSIDLMYGLPGQNLKMFCKDLHQAFSLPVKHLSSYALSIEEGTALHRKIANGELAVADEECYLAEYEALMNAAAVHGFEHYEISNFALPGFYSRHNSAYWDGTPYLGCGPGAHSFDGKNRWYNRPDLMSYIQHTGIPPHELEVLTREEHFNELVFTALRTSKGLNLEQVRNEYGESWLQEMLQEADPHLRNGRLERTNSHIKLTRKGIFVSNDVMSDLMR